MGSVFSSLTPKKGDEVFYFSRDIVVCIIIQLEKINTMKAYRVVYTEEGCIRCFFSKYRKMLKEVFKMCKAHLMIQSIYKLDRIILKKEYDSLNFTFGVYIKKDQNLHDYIHFSYYNYHNGKRRQCYTRIISGVGLTVIFCDLKSLKLDYPVMKITKFKHGGHVGIIEEYEEDDYCNFCWDK